MKNQCDADPNDLPMILRVLSVEEVGSVSGGIPYGTAVTVALLDTASLGPLVLAFGVGYVVGTVIYDNWKLDWWP